MIRELAEANGTWTKSLIAPVRAVPPEAVRGHALQNCRTVAKAAAHLLRTDSSHRTPERFARYRRAAAALRARICEDLANPASRKLEPVVEVEPALLLTDVCDRARDYAEAKDVTLIVHASMPRFRLRQREFAEAMFNIVVNAIDAARKGYPVFVSAAKTRDGNLLWEVQDSGTGMVPAVLAWLGEPFRSTREGAMGVGVPIARSIVEAHGGILSFESAPGVGTTARAWTPALWS